MKKKLVFLFILNIVFSTAVSCKLFNSDMGYDYLSLSTENDSIEITTQTYLQPLNHFSNEDEGKWLQRYAISTTYHKKSGPAFLFLRGSNPMKEGYEFSRHVLTYAKHLNAICFALEHRFYGINQPVNGSLSRHLNIAQILADIANFVKGMLIEFHLPISTKWIVFGCSYGGALAAWARRTYSNLIYGAVVSSAPLLAKADYYEYEQILEESLKFYDSKCVESITQAFEEIAHLVITPLNVKTILQMFYLGDDLCNKWEIIKKLIIHTMVRIISGAVQNNDVPTAPINISSLCRTMMQYDGKKIEALARIRKIVKEHEKGEVKIVKEPEKCEVKIQLDRSLSGQNVADDENERINQAWRYQRCTEFGYFSSYYTNATFLHPVKHLLMTIDVDIRVICESFFGENVQNVTTKVRQTNLLYGGLDFNVSNTLFIYGSLDPYYKVGLYQKSNTSLYETIFITGASHCADYYPPSDRDIPELRNARNQVLRALKNWLIDPL